jgi:hypothetical protein
MLKVNLSSKQKLDLEAAINERKEADKRFAQKVKTCEDSLIEKFTDSISKNYGDHNYFYLAKFAACKDLTYSQVFRDVKTINLEDKHEFTIEKYDAGNFDAEHLVSFTRKN